MTQILVTKHGILSKADKAKLRRSGVVTVEADDPSQVKLIQPNVELSAGDMAWAAMAAIVSNGSDFTKRDLARNLLQCIEATRSLTTGAD